MPPTKSARMHDHFAELTDPRRREVTYPLINMVVIGVCAVLCRADDFVAIAKFGRSKQAWLSRFLDLSSGIPSHDRFNAILAALKPAEFEKCLLSWITKLHEITDGQVIAIDGKTLRRSYDAARGKSAIHMLGLGHGQPDQFGTGRRGRQEQRDHSHPETAGNAGIVGGFGHDRCHGVPGRDCRSQRRPRLAQFGLQNCHPCQHKFQLLSKIIHDPQTFASNPL